MSWIKLAFGTAILGSITLGTAIYYGGSRAQVKTEDIVELLEGIAERQLVINDAVGTNTITWAQATFSTANPSVQWDGTNLTDGYLAWDGVSNQIPTSYVTPDGTISCTNTFVTTGQWFRGWVPVITNVGRIKDKLYKDFTVTVSDPDYAGFMDGTYIWSSTTTGNIGVVEHVWEFLTPYGETIELVQTADDPVYGWLFRYNDWPIAWTLREDQWGGSYSSPEWYYDLGTMSVELSGSGGMPGTNITVSTVGTNTIYTTNITAIYHPEFPARILTNVANAVGIYDLAAIMSYIDGSIEGIVPQFVDHSLLSGGTFDSWFLEPANSNATSLPKLNMSNVVARLGETVGTNINGFTYLLNYPARGTNEALYGGSCPYVTQARLTARKKILEYLKMTERSGGWWAGELTIKATNSYAPFGLDGSGGDSPYTLTFPGWGPAVTSPITNVAPSYQSTINLALRFYHYPPGEQPTEWYHTASSASDYRENRSSIKFTHNYLFNSESVHGYANETGSIYSIGAFTVSGTNAISGLVEVRSKNTTYGSGMSASSVGAPYSAYNYPDAYEQQWSLTNAYMPQRSLGIGPVCIEWNFTKCVP